MRWLSLLAPVLLGWFVVAVALERPAPGTSGRHLVVALATAAFVVAVFGRNATVNRRKGWAHLAFVAILIAGAVTLVWVQPNGPGAEAVLLGGLCIAVLSPPRVAVAVLAAVFALLVVVVAVTNAGYWNLATLAILGGFYGMLFLAFRLAEANREAERLLSELRASQAAQAKAAGLAERQHLAREMHDVLAHSLSGLILQLEGARMMAAEDPTDPRLPEAVHRAHQLGKTGLQESRRAIGMLRDDELPGPERLAALAAEFEQHREVPCRLTVYGEAHELGSEARLAVYRVAQEALTNITKHAHPERVELRLSYEPAATRLVVEDFAGRCRDRGPVDAGGYGLAGMRERAELLGGRLITEATQRGFRIELDVPA